MGCLPVDVGVASTDQHWSSRKHRIRLGFTSHHLDRINVGTIVWRPVGGSKLQSCRYDMGQASY
jgi:hypothetical protein